MAAIAMVATMAQTVSASAVNSVSRSWAPAEYSWGTRRLEAEHALSSLRLQHVNEQQHSSSPTYILILSAIVCVTLLAIAMVWNSNNDDRDDHDGRDDYNARRAHEAQREEMLAQIRDHDTHDLNHVIGAGVRDQLYRVNSGTEIHIPWNHSCLYGPNDTFQYLGELFPTFIDRDDAGYNEDGLEESYHARIQAVARARSVTSWASLAANVAANAARMHFLQTSYWYPTKYRAYVESTPEEDNQFSQLMSNLHVSTQLQQPLTPVEYYQRQHGVLVESCSVFDAKVTKPEGDYFRKKYPGIAIVRAVVHPIPYDCPVLCGYWVLNAANDEVLEYVPPEISELGPAYKFLPLLPPQSPAQHEHLAQYLKWRRENYPDGRPPIWIEEDHPCPQIRAWRAANPDVQLTIRVATTQAPVPLPEWYRALV